MLMSLLNFIFYFLIMCCISIKTLVIRIDIKLLIYPFYGMVYKERVGIVISLYVSCFYDPLVNFYCGPLDSLRQRLLLHLLFCGNCSIQDDCNIYLTQNDIPVTLLWNYMDSACLLY
ncbi:hypothetical protein Hanom_Chr13g01221861 [Helianthus anomalus]